MKKNSIITSLCLFAGSFANVFSSQENNSFVDENTGSISTYKSNGTAYSESDSNKDSDLELSQESKALIEKAKQIFKSKENQDLVLIPLSIFKDDKYTKKLQEIKNINFVKYFPENLKNCTNKNTKEINVEACKGEEIKITKNRTGYKFNFKFDNNETKNKIIEIINTIFARDEKIKQELLEFLNKKIVFDAKERLSYSFTRDRIVIGQDDIELNNLYSKITHELGHRYHCQISPLTLLMEIDETQNSIVDESISILFEFISAIILKDSYDLFSSLKTYSFNAIKYSFCLYSHISNKTKNNTINIENITINDYASAYIFGVIFAINMINKCGKFENDKFSFDMEKLKDEIKNIDTAFYNKKNITEYYIDNYFNAKTITDTLDNIIKYFKLQPKQEAYQCIYYDYYTLNSLDLSYHLLQEQIEDIDFKNAVPSVYFDSLQEVANAIGKELDAFEQSEKTNTNDNE